jgi:hypothetical protein
MNKTMAIPLPKKSGISNYRIPAYKKLLYDINLIFLSFSDFENFSRIKIIYLKVLNSHLTVPF